MSESNHFRPASRQSLPAPGLSAEEEEEESLRRFLLLAASWSLHRHRERVSSVAVPA